jgi:hypothetical protein
MAQDPLLIRIRAEYLEMPGLRLTPAQAARLFGLDHDTCGRVLRDLVETSFLSARPDGSYARATDGADGPRPRPQWRASWAGAPR